MRVRALAIRKICSQYNLGMLIDDPGVMTVDQSTTMPTMEEVAFFGEQAAQRPVAAPPVSKPFTPATALAEEPAVLSNALEPAVLENAEEPAVLSNATDVRQTATETEWPWSCAVGNHSSRWREDTWDRSHLDFRGNIIGVPKCPRCSSKQPTPYG